MWIFSVMTKGRSPEEKCILPSGIAPIGGGEGEVPPNFFCIFGQENDNNFNSKLFLGCIFIVYNIVYSIFSPKLTYKSWILIVYYIVYIVFLVLNWLKNLEFWLYIT